MAGYHGGARTGAGRPPKFEKQLAIAAKTVKELQEVVKGGLTQIGGRLPELLEAEIETALDEDIAPGTRQKSRQYLINLILGNVKMEEDVGSKLQDMVQRWTQINVEGDLKIGNVADESPGPGEDIRVEVVEGTGRSLPAGQPS